MTVPSSARGPEVTKGSGPGPEWKGLGFPVPVLLRGMACLSAPSLLLRGRLGGAPREGPS